MEPPDQAGCGVTVLRAGVGKRATKSWDWNPAKSQWTKIDYNAGRWFTAQGHRFADLLGLGALLEQLQRESHAFFVRGALTPETAEQLRANPDKRIPRLKHAKGQTPASLMEVPRQWIVCDIDGFPLRPSDDLADDPDLAIDHAIYELLPKAFHDATCFWQLSSSAGFAAGILKCHLFFWLSEPATNEHVKAVLKQHAPAIDTAPFNAAQAIYIAAPIITGGHDPIPRRTGWRKGLEQEVILPALKPAQPRQRTAGGNGSTATARGQGLDGALAYMGDGDGLDGFHHPLLTTSMRYAGWCNRGGQRDDEAFKEKLRAAIEAAPARPGRDVSGYCADSYLDRSIAGAFARAASQEEIQSMAPEYEAATKTLEEAKAEIQQHVGGFMQRALEWHRLSEEEQKNQPPPCDGIASDVGTGKSYIGQQELGPGFIEPARAERLPHRTGWLVPYHRLSNQALQDMEGMGLNVAVCRGREADDPDAAPADEPESDEPDLDGVLLEKPEPQKMCLNLPAVEDSVSANYDVEQTACGSPEPGKRVCPFYKECGYQKQKAKVASADIVIASHQSLFTHMLQGASTGWGAVIVDEKWWEIGARRNQIIPVSSLTAVPRTHPVLSTRKGLDGKERQVVDEFGTNDLITLSGRLEAAALAIFNEAQAAKQTGDVFFSRTAAVAAGLTADDCTMAISLEWRRELEGLIWPGQRPDDRAKAAAKAAGNKTIPRRAALWNALRELLGGNETHTGRLQVGIRADKDGEYLAIVCHTRADVLEKITKLPILLLDATMPADIVRHYLPHLDVLANVRVHTPYVTVHQVIGGFGRTTLVPYKPGTGDPPLTAAQETENRHRLRKVDALADFVRAFRGWGEAGVITYMDIEQRFEDSGILTGHFGAVVGLNKFEDVRNLFIVGRPLPKPQDVHTLTLALTGKPIPYEDTVLVTRGVLRPDGSGTPMSVRAYVNPNLEATRAAITDADIVQDAGRGRAVRRTANTPLDIWVLADVVLPMVVDGLVRQEALAMNPIERMAARGAVFFSPSDAARMYPDLFETAEAARKTLVRYEGLFTGHSPKINGTLRGMSGKTVFEINYRPAGRGQNLRQAIAAEWRLPGLRKLMGDKIGLMKQFDVEELPEPPEPPDNPPPPSPSATTPPPTPTPPSPDDGDAPVFEQDDPGWTADPWHQAKPPDDDGLAWDEVAEGTADDG